MAAVRWTRHPTLRRPVLVTAFEGWNDAADAASAAVLYLHRQWGARGFAELDGEEFYDFTTVRPRIRLNESRVRRIEWPKVTFSAASLPGANRDVVLLTGPEPQLRWRTFSDEILTMVKHFDVDMAVTLGALLADVPHSRPVRVTGTSADPALAERLGLARSRYEGPTGILGVLQDAFSRAGIPSLSLWANVPHYVPQGPSPKATLALVERTAVALETAVEVVDLQVATAAYERQVDELVEADEEAAAYVARLEREEGEDDDEDEDEQLSDQLDNSDPDELAAEVERFLRDHRRD